MDSVLLMALDSNGTERRVLVNPDGTLPITVLNFPAIQPISGTVNAVQSGTWTVAVSNFPPISGTVEVSDGTNTVFTSSHPAYVQGSISVSNFPTSFAVSNFPATQAITGTIVADQGGSWTVAVSNFPATQSVSGSVSVSNFPATQAVSGTITANQGGAPWSVTFPSAQHVIVDSGTVSVSNFPATQAVSGTVAVSNFPATQAVSGTVAVSNFPATQNVNVASFGGSPVALQGGLPAVWVFSNSADFGATVVQPNPGQLNATVTIAGVPSVIEVPNTSGGVSTHVEQALTTEAEVKASPGQFYGFDWFNPNAVPVYVFIYNTTSAPSIGSTANLIYQKGIPAGAGSNQEFKLGIPCSTGIFIAVSTSPTSAAAPGTGLILTTLYM